MSKNKQPFDKHDENAGSMKAQPSVHPAGSRRRVAYAALAGAAFGGVVSAIAAALTGKGVADGVQAVVEAAVDTLKRATDGVQASVEATADTVKRATDGVQASVEATADTVKRATDGVQPSVKGDFTIVHGGRDAGGVSTPMQKERVVERTPPVEAVRSVAPGETDFQKGEVARIEVEDQTAEIQTIPQSLDVPAATGAAHGAALNATHGVANDATPNTANDATPNAALVQLLLSQVSTEVAMSFYEQLPAAVFGEIHRLATNPTPEEKQRIRDSWAKAIEPLAMAIVLSGQSNFSAVPAASNGHQKQANQLEGSSDGSS